MDDIDVKRLRLEPGDMVVLQAKTLLPDHILERLKHDFADLVPGHRVIVLDAGMELSVLTRAEVETILSVAA